MKKLPIEKKIEEAVASRFCGVKIDFTLREDMSWSFTTEDGSKLDFYDMYPNLTKAEADEELISEIKNILTGFLFYDTIIENMEKG